MKIIDNLKNELDDFTIYDNYIQNSSINGAPIEYILIGINNHYYALSHLKHYVICEIEKPERDAYMVGPTSFYSRKGIIEYLRKLRILVK